MKRMEEDSIVQDNGFTAETPSVETELDTPGNNLLQAHKQFIQEQALILFDRTKPLHELSDGCRNVLEMACLYANQPLPGRKKNPIKDAMLLVMENADQQLAADQINVLGAVLAVDSGKIKRKKLSSYNLSPLQQRDVLTIAALLQVAYGLDYSNTQSTTIKHIESSRNGVWIVVDGPEATTDSSEAQQNARLWFKIGFPKIKIMEPDKAETKLVPFPEPMERPGIEPEDALAEAGRKVMRFHFAEMLRHEEGTRLGKDIEALHDMRVATRRLRAAFEVFESAYKPGALRSYLSGLRSTGRALGKVRDLDVFKEKAVLYLDSLPEQQHSDLEPLIGLWESQRETARQDLLEYMDSEDYSKFKRKFNGFLKTQGAGVRKLRKDTPIPNTVWEKTPALIYRRLAGVRAYDSYLDDPPVELLHALRIEFKKLRYSVEYFTEVLGPETEQVVEDLKKIQDHLGNLTDAHIAVQMLGSFIEKQQSKKTKEGDGAPPSMSGVETYKLYRIEELDRLISTFPERWEYFKSPEFNQNLAKAVSAL